MFNSIRACLIWFFLCVVVAMVSWPTPAWESTAPQKIRLWSGATPIVVPFKTLYGFPVSKQKLRLLCQNEQLHLTKDTTRFFPKVFAFCWNHGAWYWSNVTPGVPHEYPGWFVWSVVLYDDATYIQEVTTLKFIFLTLWLSLAFIGMIASAIRMVSVGSEKQREPTRS